MTTRRRPTRTAGNRRSLTSGSFRNRSKKGQGRREKERWKGAFSLSTVAHLRQQTDKLAENHRRRAPYLVTEQIEVGIFDRNALADSRPLANPRGVPQMVK